MILFATYIKNKKIIYFPFCNIKIFICIPIVIVETIINRNKIKFSTDTIFTKTWKIYIQYGLYYLYLDISNEQIHQELPSVRCFLFIEVFPLGNQFVAKFSLSPHIIYSTKLLLCIYILYKQVSLPIYIFLLIFFFYFSQIKGVIFPHCIL